jgi:hypothetical protein
MRSFFRLVLVGVLLAGCESGVGTVSVRTVGPAPAEPVGDAGDRFALRLEAALAMSNAFERNDVLEKLAVSAAEAGQADVVKKCLAELSNAFTRNETAGRCALLLARAGQGVAAIAVAREISNTFERDDVLKKLAEGG